MNHSALGDERISISDVRETARVFIDRPTTNRLIIVQLSATCKSAFGKPQSPIVGENKHERLQLSRKEERNRMQCQNDKKKSAIGRHRSFARVNLMTEHETGDERSTYEWLLPFES